MMIARLWTKMAIRTASTGVFWIAPAMLYRQRALQNDNEFNSRGGIFNVLDSDSETKT